MTIFPTRNLDKWLRKLVHLNMVKCGFILKNLLNKLIVVRRNKMDWRVVVVVAPLAIAASWAIFNIGSAALAQVQKYFNK